MRIVSDRLIGEVFFKDPRLMDFELLGGSARKVIEAEAADHGFKAILPPKFHSTVMLGRGKQILAQVQDRAIWIKFIDKRSCARIYIMV